MKKMRINMIKRDMSQTKPFVEKTIYNQLSDILPKNGKTFADLNKSKFASSSLSNQRTFLIDDYIEQVRKIKLNDDEISQSLLLPNNVELNHKAIGKYVKYERQLKGLTKANIVKQLFLSEDDNQTEAYRKKYFSKCMILTKFEQGISTLVTVNDVIQMINYLKSLESKTYYLYFPIKKFIADNDITSQKDLFSKILNNPTACYNFKNNKEVSLQSYLLAMHNIGCNDQTIIDCLKLNDLNNIIPIAPINLSSDTNLVQYLKKIQIKKNLAMYDLFSKGELSIGYVYRLLDGKTVHPNLFKVYRLINTMNQLVLNQNDV